MKISDISNIIHITLMFLPLSKKFLYVLLNSFLLLSPISCKAVSVNPTELLRCASSIPWDVFMISHTFGLGCPPPLSPVFCFSLLKLHLYTFHQLFPFQAKAISSQLQILKEFDSCYGDVKKPQPPIAAKASLPLVQRFVHLWVQCPTG